MDWSRARELITQHGPDFEGPLYRGVENTGTIVRSSLAELEIGPIRWELPKRIRYSRSDKTWYYEEVGEWSLWEDAEKQGLSAFILLDPRWYVSFEKVDEQERPLPFDGFELRVSFAARELFTAIGLTSELTDWCSDLVGETHEVVFLWNQEELRAITQRDFWLTDEPTTVFLHTGTAIPAPLLGPALR